MEIPAISGRCHKAGANDKVAKAFAAVALLGISGKQRIERGDNSVVFQILRVKLRQPRAVERGRSLPSIATPSQQPSKVALAVGRLTRIMHQTKLFARYAS